MIITRYQVKGPKLKAAVVADLHGEPKTELYKELQEEKPDVILIPGDLATVGIYDGSVTVDPERLRKRAEGQKKAFEFLKAAVNIAPTFYSRGNHEWGINDEYREKAKATGTVLLENEWIKFGDVWIGGQNSAKRYGIGELTDEKKAPDTQWLKNTPDGFRILLCHHPEYYDLVKDYADLVLAAHVHGGQFRFFGRGVFAPGQGFLPRFSKGVYGKMIVSAGLTNTTWIPRINNPTELVIVEMG